MLVWLASYPRSGNTLLRILLKQAFGLETYSIYDDSQSGIKDVGVIEGLASAVGHRGYGKNRRDFLEWARASPQWVFVKTHDLAPAAPDRAIYVVRDGRAVVESYHQYQESVAKRPVSRSDIISGKIWAGSWSRHVDSWVGGTYRGPILTVRFEDLAGDPADCLQRIAEFLSLKRPGPVTLDFDDMRQSFPTFFRSGSNTANIGALSASEIEQFLHMHGPTMHRLQYIDNGASNNTTPDVSLTTSARKEIDDEVARRVVAYLDITLRTLTACRLASRREVNDARAKFEAMRDHCSRTEREVSDWAYLELRSHERALSSVRATIASRASKRRPISADA